MKRRHGGLLWVVVAAALVSACATVQSRWEAARSANTIEAYEDFLKKHPESDLADQARVRRNELREERDWKDAEAGHTAEAYKDFLRRYPQGRHKDHANVRLETLSRPESNDSPPAGVGTFLRRYRDGVFMDEPLMTSGNLSPEQTITNVGIPVYEPFPDRQPDRVPDDEARPGREMPDDVKSESGGEGSNIPNAVKPASAWGKIMYPQRKMNIRCARSAVSRLKGRLETGKPVKVDFLEKNWYAVFPVNQKQRNEKMALGYVYAPFLTDKWGSDSPGSAVSGEKSSGDAPPEKMGPEGLSVDVRNLTFKGAGDGKELLLVEFDRFYTPAIFKIEGERPRIILKVKNASSFRKDWAVIHTGGHFIRRIRSSIDPHTREATIVLDMATEKNYFVNQKFYEKENVYSLEISGTE